MKVTHIAIVCAFLVAVASAAEREETQNPGPGVYKPSKITKGNPETWQKMPKHRPVTWYLKPRNVTAPPTVPKPPNVPKPPTGITIHPPADPVPACKPLPTGITEGVDRVYTSSGHHWRECTGDFVDKNTFTGFTIKDGNDWRATTVEGSFPLDQASDKAYQPQTPADKAALATFLKGVPAHTADTKGTYLPNLCSTPNMADTSQFQSALESQYNRKTSTSFATIAALEAVYKRQLGLSLDLSEQFMNWVMLTTQLRLSHGALDVAKRGIYENKCSYFGGGNSHEAVDALMTYGVPTEKAVPYAGAAVMKAKLPQGVEFNAPSSTSQYDVDRFEYSRANLRSDAVHEAKYGVASALKLWQSDIQNICNVERILSAGHEIIVDFRTQWRNVHGIINYDASQPENNYHTMLVVGYDKLKQVFLCKNSWGGSSYTQISYLVMQRTAVGGAVILAANAPYGYQAHVQRNALQLLGRWHADFNGKRGLLVIRRVAPATQIGTFFPGHNSSNAKVVSGVIGDDGRSIKVSVDAGPSIKLFVHSGQPDLASGVSLGVHLHGAYMTRQRITPHSADTPFRTKKIVGVWTLTVDGELYGRVKLGPFIAPKKTERNSVRLVAAKFQDHLGLGQPIKAHVLYKNEYGTDGHVVRLDIGRTGDITSKHIWLVFHTKEKKVMTGWTHSSTHKTFPVYAFKETL